MLALKNPWVPLVNKQQVFEHMFDSLSVDRFLFIIDVREQSNEKFDNETVDKAYCCCRDKVCELSIVRALFRPLSEHETRKGAETKSHRVCQALEGVLNEVACPEDHQHSQSNLKIVSRSSSQREACPQLR